MADKNDGADKSELPTPKKLRDARNKGDVAKSKDLGAGLLTCAWLILFAFVSGFVAKELARFTTAALTAATQTPFEQAAPAIGWDALMTLLRISLMTLLPVAIIATFAEFVQVGALFTTEKMKFGLEKLNPMEG
jgi:type III secretion protein U